MRQIDSPNGTSQLRHRNSTCDVGAAVGDVE
jgi:hypothetical protein